MIHAEQLVRAYRDGLSIDATPASGPSDDEAAYAVQRAVWQQLAGTLRPRAWKVGAASRDAIPIAAPVFPDNLFTGRAGFPHGRFRQPRVEAEIAFRFGRDLSPRASGYVRQEWLDAIESAHVAMEVVDTRLADAEGAGPHWRLADNLLNGALILGEALPDWCGMGDGVRDIRIEADGRLIAEAMARPPLGDLMHCLNWWLGHIGGIEAGDIVTTGAWNGAHAIGEAREVRAIFTGLGQAAASFRTQD